ncbi:MAG TPA: TetR/AcrR family transcriptional regulator [Clostridia bacterium]|nr:TetR/AcrR family transcriptional regulator [Clostridia bacterium]
MRKSKQDYVGIDNRQRILEAATDLFIQQGAQDTSLAEIAQALNISKGTLYYYYSSKADLIFDVTDVYMQELTEGLLDWVKSLKEKTAPENILEAVFHTIFNAETRGKLHIYLIHEAITTQGQLQEKIKAAYGRWKLMLQEGLDTVFGDTLDTKVYADIILTMLTGGIVHTIIGVEMAPLKELIHPLLYK